MRCIAPPALDDDTLSQVIDNVAESWVVAHLAHCAFCAARLHQAKQFEQRLAAVSYRWDCIRYDVLTQYATERASLPVALVDWIGHHVEQCGACRADIDTIGLAHAASSSLRLDMPVIVARLQSRQPVMALRGSAVEGPIIAEAGDVTVLLEIHHDAASDSLIGQVLAERLEEWHGARVEVRAAGEIISTASVDEQNAFVCLLTDVVVTEVSIRPHNGQAISIPLDETC